MDTYPFLTVAIFWVVQYEQIFPFVFVFALPVFGTEHILFVIRENSQ